MIDSTGKPSTHGRASAFLWNFLKGRICGVIVFIVGCMLLLAFALFLFNVVITFGVKGLIGIYLPAKSDTSDCVPAPQEA